MFYNKKLRRVIELHQMMCDIEAVEQILSGLEFPSEGFRLSASEHGSVLSFVPETKTILCYPNMIDVPPLINLSDAWAVCGPMKAKELFDYLPDYLELCLDNLKPKMGEK